jgi:hypothetical protein
MEDGQARLRNRLPLVPCTLKIANTFVAEHHRHNKPVAGAKITLGVADEQGTLRGVAIIGCPVARMLCDGWTLEVTRVATDGCPNACSALYGAARRIAFQLGYHRIVTYTLQAESGASLRGAGWRQVAEVHPAEGPGWLSRLGRTPQAVYGLSKYRWEATTPSYSEVSNS